MAPGHQRIGVDVVPIARIERSMARDQTRFMKRLLTGFEIDYCLGPNLFERVAGRVAAKEAVMKILGDGWPRVAWTDIEVTSAGRRPKVTLREKALSLALREGLEPGSIDVSITHDGGIAIAVACGFSKEGS